MFPAVVNYEWESSALADEQNRAANVFNLDGSRYARNTADSFAQKNYEAVRAPSRDTEQSSETYVMPTEQELVDAKLAAAEARTDTKILRFESKIDALAKDVGEHRRDRNLIIGTIVVAAIALGALFVSMATYGDALFGRGLAVRDVIQATIKETLEQTKKVP
jgi:hypothetical protein